MGLFAITFILIHVFVAIESLPECSKEQFTYTYTSCDADGTRWRVAIPETDQCEGGTPPSPVKAKDCSFMCDPGKYLNITEQLCKQCPKGTYKAGSSVRIYDDWTDLPKGFTSVSKSLSKYENIMNKQKLTKDDCDSVSWEPKETYIASFGGSCMGILQYTANLLKPGYIEFEYQYTDSNGLFELTIQNDKCKSVQDAANRWPNKTMMDEWGVFKARLERGRNIISWMTLSFASNVANVRTQTKLRKIEISGIYTNDECLECRSGTHSGEGSNECSICPRNTFSKASAFKCDNCDEKTSFSLPGSSECTNRKPCTTDDYISLNSTCDSKQKTHVSYEWIQPKICSDADSSSVKLPDEGPSKECPPCNPGMFLEVVRGSNSCLFCGDGSYSSDGTECVKCEDNTEAKPMVDIRWWNNLPKEVNLSTYCFPLSTVGCRDFSVPSWTFDSDHVRSAKGFASDDFQALTMNISGFDPNHYKNLGNFEFSYSSIEFVFDMECRTDCTFTFFSGFETIINTWYGSHKRLKYKHYITYPGPVLLNWVFQKTSNSLTKKSGTDRIELDMKIRNDRVNIYSLKVTNTLTGGAVQCTKCPKGINKHGCIQCKPGNFLEDNECITCPPGEILRGDTRKDCKPCGDGLLPDKQGLNCVSTCKYTAQCGHSYDFTAISKPHQISTEKQFTSMGKRYYHQFNISLCSSDEPVICSNNYNISYKGRLYAKSSICRSTLIPSKDKETIVVQSLSLGDSLVEITTNISNHNISQLMETGGFKENGEIQDVHFVYQAKRTSACPQGRKTIISLRCDVTLNERLKIELPPKCSDGTCDGCVFHFLFRSKDACPKCRDNIGEVEDEEDHDEVNINGEHKISNLTTKPESDYKVIRGECMGGKQTIIYQHPSYCPVKAEVIQECAILPTWAVQIMGGIVLMFIIMFFVLIYCWKKNSKLEYKYMKLIVSSNGELELPPAETCAIDDDEEESEDDQFRITGLNEQVRFSKGDKGDHVTNSLMSKLKKKSENKSNGFENVSLTENMS